MAIVQPISLKTDAVENEIDSIPKFIPEKEQKEHEGFPVQKRKSPQKDLKRNCFIILLGDQLNSLPMFVFACTTLLAVTTGLACLRLSVSADD